jgi:hypothetical protein
LGYCGVSDKPRSNFPTPENHHGINVKTDTDRIGSFVKEEDYARVFGKFP